MAKLQSFLGLLSFIAVAWVLSEHRARASIKLAVTGLALQLALAWLVLKVPPVNRAFAALNQMVLALQEATQAGTSFVFGYLGGGPLPFEMTEPGASFILAFRALPLIIVMSALAAVLTYWRVLPMVVRGFAFALTRSFRVGGAVGLGTAANVFLGMVEAPLMVRPYLATLTRSELFVLMTAGMATVAGTMLVLYASILAPLVPDAAGHLLAASIISAPAAVTIALLMIPETETSRAEAELSASPATSTMEAIASGTQDGTTLYIQVTAMLVVLVALVALVNGMLGWWRVGGEELSLQLILGYLMAPVTWLMGIPWSEARAAGALMGVKTVLNEFLAYLQMSALGPEELSARSRLIMTYALCGFANLGSLGILVGGLATMVPQRRQEVVALGMRSIVAGTLATCCTGAVVGVLTID